MVEKMRDQALAATQHLNTNLFAVLPLETNSIGWRLDQLRVREPGMHPLRMEASRHSYASGSSSALSGGELLAMEAMRDRFWPITVSMTLAIR